MTDTANNSVSPARALLFSSAMGVVSGAVLMAATGLSPLASADRPALAIMAVCLSLPLGTALSRTLQNAREARLRGGSALLAGALLALVTTVAEPALCLRTASWCAAGALAGISLGGLARGANLLVLLAWLALCGLPFFSGAMGPWRGVAETLALNACPWLGFAQDAVVSDPLRQSKIYLGQLSSLTDQPALNLMSAASLWLIALVALAAGMLRGLRVQRAVAPVGQQA